MLRLAHSLRMVNCAVSRRSASSSSCIDVSKASSQFDSSHLIVVPDFITEEEHDALVKDAEKSLRKRKYEPGHWDGVIQKFREVEKWQWSELSMRAIQRVHDHSFCDPGTRFQPVSTLTRTRHS